MAEISKTTLPNGVRIVTERLEHVGSASIGVWCQTGSVDELANEAGITHLIEHMLFKGTERRDALQIASEIEGRGGMLNAFTDKESTCYYCRVLADDATHGIDVLTDMVMNSKIDPTELEREKGVVLEEIKRGEDEPGDLVHDLHMEALWKGHEIGLPVIGTKESVASFSRDDIQTYRARQYRGDRILVSVAGNIQHEEIVDAVTASLGKSPEGGKKEILRKPEYSIAENLVTKDVEQVHFCIGGDGKSSYDPDVYGMHVLDGILGSGMSSRLFQEVREKRGLVYAVGSYHVTYTCGGAFTIYGGTGLKTWDELQKVVRDVLDDLIDRGPTEEELERVKRLICGNMILGLESTQARMMRMAKNELIHGKAIPIEETRSKIEAVTAQQVQLLAKQLLGKDALRTTAIGPFAQK